jgi:hypothetical protein
MDRFTGAWRPFFPIENQLSVVSRQVPVKLGNQPLATVFTRGGASADDSRYAEPA